MNYVSITFKKHLNLYFYDVIITFVKYELVRRFPKNCRYAIKVEVGEIKMANIKSAKKRIKITETKTLRNKMIKSSLKTAIKKFEVATTKEEATAAFAVAARALDMSVSKGVIHKNMAARKKSRLAARLNKMA